MLTHTSGNNALQASTAGNTEDVQRLAGNADLSAWGMELEHHFALHQGLDQVDADPDLRQVRPRPLISPGPHRHWAQAGYGVQPCHPSGSQPVHLPHCDLLQNRVSKLNALMVNECTAVVSTSAQSQAHGGHSTAEAKRICELHACTICRVIGKLISFFLSHMLKQGAVLCNQLPCELPRIQSMQSMPSVFETPLASGLLHDPIRSAVWQCWMAVHPQ